MTEKNLLEQILSEVQGMKQSFGSLENRMDKMDERFDSIDLRLDKMDDRFDSIDLRLDKMDDRFDSIDLRLDKMDDRQDKIDQKIDRNYDAVMSFFSRQQEINTETSEKLNFIMGQLDMHNTQIALNTAMLKQRSFG